jgi:hypothetical protein
MAIGLTAGSTKMVGIVTHVSTVFTPNSMVVNGMQMQPRAPVTEGRVSLHVSVARYRPARWHTIFSDGIGRRRHYCNALPKSASRVDRCVFSSNDCLDA